MTSTPWSVDYGRITPLIVKAVLDIANLANTFKSKLIAWFADASNGIGDFFAATLHSHKDITDQLCVAKSDGAQFCVTGDQLAAMAAADASTSGVEAPASQPAPRDGSAGNVSINTASNDNALPVLHINGDNPATITVGDHYADLGAQITGPTADLNLGIHTFVDGLASDPVAIDTSTAGSHTIEYVVSDSSDLISTSTRTVIVSAPANDNVAATTTTPAANDNTPLTPLPATGTEATTTAQ